MVPAVRGSSPVIITVVIPAARQALIAGSAPPRGGSAIATIPSRRRSDSIEAGCSDAWLTHRSASASTR